MNSSRNKYPIIKIRQGKDLAIKRFHPWVFSGAVQQQPSNLLPGSLVSVCDFHGNFLGTGFYEADTIAIKMLCFDESVIDGNFWYGKLQNALDLRKQLGLFHNPETNAFRLVHSEGDGLPGLIIDLYHRTAVIQTQSYGMKLHRDVILEALIQLMPESIDSVYDKSTEALTRMNKESGQNAYVFGSAQDSIIIENQAYFKVDWEKGQKTGFFLDQRDNRLLLQKLSKGRHVLNTFSYSGGFSVAALKGGAVSVVSVDSSKTALELCDFNVALNGFHASEHVSVCMDAKQYLENLSGDEFDIIILDPPAFAKNHHNRHKGLQGYKFINAKAIKKIARGGFLVTFSCSQAVDSSTFQSIVMAAAIECGRSAKVLYHLSQPADHPVSLFHPEGAYLKGLVIQIDA